MQERLHKYEVELSEEQRFVLQQFIAKGHASARQLAHARILLKIDRNAPGPRWTDEQAAEVFEMSRYPVMRIRERFVHHGLDDALSHRHHTHTRTSQRCRPHLKATTDSWRVDETYVKVKKVWMYLYRAVDSQGNTLEFRLSLTRDAQAAKAFFSKTLAAPHTPSRDHRR